MEMKLIRLLPSDADELLTLQKRGFADIYEKYRDDATSPVRQSIDHLTAKLEQPFTFFYRIDCGGETIGAICVHDKGDGESKRISPLFILPEHRGHGYAQQAIRTVEAIHGAAGWSLGTIAQEPRNRHLYEKMGYRLTGASKTVNDRMTIVFYEK